MHYCHLKSLMAAAPNSAEVKYIFFKLLCELKNNAYYLCFNRSLIAYNMPTPSPMCTYFLHIYTYPKCTECSACIPMCIYFCWIFISFSIWTFAWKNKRMRSTYIRSFYIIYVYSYRNLHTIYSKPFINI